MRLIKWVIGSSYKICLRINLRGLKTEQRFEDCFSDNVDLTSSVPRGSILTLLFIICNKDVDNLLTATFA